MYEVKEYNLFSQWANGRYYWMSVDHMPTSLTSKDIKVIESAEYDELISELEDLRSQLVSLEAMEGL